MHAKFDTKSDPTYGAKLDGKNGVKKGRKIGTKIDVKISTKLEAKNGIRPDAKIGTNWM